MVDALYFADGEATLWAEWYRHLAEHGVPPLQQLPRDLWRYRVGPRKVADLSDAPRLGRVGLEMPTPGRRGWALYQAVGKTLWSEGWDGLLAPSAAPPEGLVLCLFVDDPSALPAEPIRRPRVVVEPLSRPRACALASESQAEGRGVRAPSSASMPEKRSPRP